MKLSQLLQEATELSKLGFSRQFIRAAFKDTHIKHDAQFKEVTKKQLTIDNMFGSLVVARTKDSEVAVIGSSKTVYVGGKSVSGFFTITVSDGKEKHRALRTPEVLALIPAGSKIYMADLQSTFYGSRDSHKNDLNQEDKERRNYEFLQYVQSTYGPALQREAEQAMEFIFKGMRHLDKRTRSLHGSPTEAERALSHAAFIEEVAENGFSKKAAEEWYQAERGFGSQYANIEKLAAATVQPAAAAKFALTVFKRIREKKQEVAELLKDALKRKLEKMSPKN